MPPSEWNAESTFERIVGIDPVSTPIVCPSSRVVTIHLGLTQPPTYLLNLDCFVIDRRMKHTL